MPNEVIIRAKNIAADIENINIDTTTARIDSNFSHPALLELDKINPENISPIQALEHLVKLKKIQSLT